MSLHAASCSDSDHDGKSYALNISYGSNDVCITNTVITTVITAATATNHDAKVSVIKKSNDASSVVKQFIQEMQY